jgi:CheY-like chemotaxis protein
MIKKFLLVDDDEDDRELFHEALRNIDDTIEVHTSENCREIISRLRKGDLHPEIIFLDINMPDINGWECLSAIKTDPKLKDIPVVMYSTSSVSQEGKKAVNNGALCFLEKPPSFIKLKDFLERVSYSSTQNLDQDLRKIAESRSHKVMVA